MEKMEDPRVSSETPEALIVSVVGGGEAAIDNVVKPSRKRKIHSFLEYPGDEWLMSETQAMEYILECLQFQTKFDLSARILCPGIGKSKIGLLLFQAGYTNIALVDIEGEAISTQQSLFSDLLSKAERPIDISTVEFLQCDLSESTKLIDKTFDIIVDKGFMDVFHRQGNVRAVWQECMRLIQDEGMFIAVSMFHAKWKGLFSTKAWPQAFYYSVDIPRFSRTRPTVARFSNPIAVIIASRQAGCLRSTAISSSSVHAYQDFHAIKKSKFPTDASMF